MRNDINFCSLWVEEFLETSKKDWVVMIDVRTQREVEIYGEIPWTHFRWDFYEDGFAEKILSLDRNTTYLVYCWHANRTAYLMEFMRQSGFQRVFDLEGGIDNYNETKK